MGRKVFVSYKYGDAQVKDLNLYESWFGQKMKIETTARHYVNELAEILDNGDHIYKGEDDGQSLADFSDEYIISALRDKIYDSSITIVLVSKGMKAYHPEKDQWIPWEISYSLKEYTRNNRTSLSNGIIAVILPDEWGSYEFFITKDDVCDCRTLKTDFLFQILRDNMFNIKMPDRRLCNGSWVYSGDSSYIQSVKWEDFKILPNYYLNKAIEIRDTKEDYNIIKTVK